MMKLKKNWLGVGTLLLLPSVAWSDVSLNATVLPTSRAVLVDETATIFATIVNGGDMTAENCTIAIDGGDGSLDFFFQTTNPATNELTGAANAPVNIEAGASQSFLLGISSAAALAGEQIQFAFDCENSEPAPNLPGVNELTLTVSDVAIPDIVALSATATNNGYVQLDQSQIGAFSVATINLGSAGEVRASVDAGGLPVDVTICQTADAVCLTDPAESVVVAQTEGETATFSIFATADSLIADDPAANRVMVSFDSNGILVGATSVSIRSARLFNRIATYPVCLQLDPTCNVDTETVAEISAVSADGMTIIYTDGEVIRLALLTLPTRLRR